MSFFRWMFGLPLAAAVTAGLFLLMSALISREHEPNDLPPDPPISILTKIKESNPQKPVRPAPPDSAPPPPDTRTNARVTSVDPIRIENPIGAKHEGLHPGEIGILRPILRHAPQYPDQCRARGAEGAVTVIFDVTERGEVVNARVLSSSNSCFDRAAVKAVLGWKYPPNARRGMTEHFTFTLTD